MESLGTERGWTGVLSEISENLYLANMGLFQEADVLVVGQVVAVVGEIVEVGEVHHVIDDVV